MPEYALIPKSSLTFCSFNPYLPFEFFNFLIILVCLLFMLSIHNNISADALLTTRLHGKAAV